MSALIKKPLLSKISAGLSVVLFYTGCTQNPVVPNTQRIDQLLKTNQLEPISPRQDTKNTCPNLDLERFTFSENDLLNLVSCFNKNKELQGLEDLMIGLQKSQKLSALGGVMQRIGKADQSVLDTFEQIKTNFEMADTQTLVKALSDSQLSKVILPMAEKVLKDSNNNIENTQVNRLDFFFTRLLAFIFDYRAPVDGPSKLKSTTSPRNILALKNLLTSKVFNDFYEQKVAQFINAAAHDTDKAQQLKTMLKELAHVAQNSGSQNPEQYRVQISDYLFKASRSGYLKDLAFFVLAKINEQNDDTNATPVLTILGRAFQDLKRKELIGCESKDVLAFKEFKVVTDDLETWNSAFLCSPNRKANDSLLKTDQEWKTLYQAQGVQRGVVKSGIPQLGKANDMQAVLRMMQELDYDAQNNFTLTHMFDDLLSAHRANVFDQQKAQFRNLIYKFFETYLAERYFDELVKFYVAEIVYPTVIKAQVENKELDNALNEVLLSKRTQITQKLDIETYDIIGKRVLGPVFNFLDFQIDKLIQDSANKNRAIDPEKLKDLKILVKGVADEVALKGIRSPLLYCAANSFGLLQGKTKYAEDKQLFQRAYVSKAMSLLKWLEKNTAQASTFFKTNEEVLLKNRGQESKVWDDAFYQDLVKKVSQIPLPDSKELPDGLIADCATSASDLKSLNQNSFKMLLNRIIKSAGKNYDGLSTPEGEDKIPSNTSELPTFFDLAFDKIWDISKKVQIPKAKDGSDLDTLALLTQLMSNFEPSTLKKVVNYAFNDLQVSKQLIGDVNSPGIMFMLVQKLGELLGPTRTYRYPEISKIDPSWMVADKNLCVQNQANFKTCDAQSTCMGLGKAAKNAQVCQNFCSFLVSEKQNCSKVYQNVCVKNLDYVNDCTEKTEDLYDSNYCDALKNKGGNSTCSVYYQTECTKNNQEKYPFDFEACGLLDPKASLNCATFLTQYNQLYNAIPNSEECAPLDPETYEQSIKTAKHCAEVDASVIAAHDKLANACNKFLDPGFCNLALAGEFYPQQSQIEASCKEAGLQELASVKNSLQSVFGFARASLKKVSKSFEQILEDVAQAGKAPLTAESPEVLAVNARFRAYYAKISFFLENIEVLPSLVNGANGDAGLLEFLIPMWKATFNHDQLNANTLRMLTRDIPETAPTFFNALVDHKLLPDTLGLLGAFSNAETDELTGSNMLADLLTGIKHLTYPLGYDSQAASAVFPISALSPLIADVEQHVDTQRLRLPYTDASAARANVLDLSTHALLALGQLPAHGLDQTLIIKSLDGLIKTEAGFKLMQEILGNPELRTKALSELHNVVDLLVAMAKTGKLNSAADNLIALDQKGNLREIAELLLSFKDPEKKFQRIKNIILEMITSGQLRNLLTVLKPLTRDLEDYYTQKEMVVHF